MSTEVALIKSEPQAVSLSDMKQMAVAIASSGLFGLKTPEQALALMLIAQAEGLHPAVAARDYDIIGGRPAKKSEAMLRSFLSSGGSVEWHVLDDTIADATFSHPQGGKIRISWNMERATKAGLYGKTDSMYKKYPRQMLRSRCISEGIRTIWPMATGGVYAPEEIEDATPIDVTPKTGGVLDRVVAQAKVQSATTEVPVPANHPEVFRSRIAAAMTEAELMAVGTDIATAGMNADEQMELRLVFRARLAQLTPPPVAAPVVAAAVPAGWAPPNPDVL